MSASIDRALQHMLTEKERSYVLKAIIEVVLFCAQNNIALRAHGQLKEDSGIFLNLIELISRSSETSFKLRTHYLSFITNIERIRLFIGKARSPKNHQ